MHTSTPSHEATARAPHGAAHAGAGRAASLRRLRARTGARTRGLALATLAAAAALAGCTTTGMGGGDLSRPGRGPEPVLFSWKSTDGGLSGTMTATLPHATYQGRFFQITQQTQRQFIEPLWVGWRPGWGDWPYWGPGDWADTTQFITRYSGKVVANLQSDGGGRMRCRLHLIDPARGMSGGGEGECQLSGGGTIAARF